MIKTEAFAVLRQFMEEGIPFNKLLGMKLTHLADGEARMEASFQPSFVGDPFRPALHGGVISSLLDTCGGAAVFTTFTSVDDRASTVDLRIDFLRPGRMEDIIAEARVVRAGNRVAVVTLKAYHPGAADQPIATGTGVYNVRRVQDV